MPCSRLWKRSAPGWRHSDSWKGQSIRVHYFADGSIERLPDLTLEPPEASKSLNSSYRFRHPWHCLPGDNTSDPSASVRDGTTMRFTAVLGSGNHQIHKQVAPQFQERCDPFPSKCPCAPIPPHELCYRSRQSPRPLIEEMSSTGSSPTPRGQGRQPRGRAPD